MTAIAMLAPPDTGLIDVAAPALSASSASRRIFQIHRCNCNLSTPHRMFLSCPLNINRTHAVAFRVCTGLIQLRQEISFRNFISDINFVSACEIRSCIYGRTPDFITFRIDMFGDTATNCGREVASFDQNLYQ